MEVKVNGEIRTFEAEEISLPELLQLLEVQPDAPGVAVALNWSVVPRSAWTATTVKGGDEVELITARQGG